ncbi:glycoside hydrolase family 32 protein [Bifidobacterium phasiani]|uniref:Sucrose-6-phosphate hydrolase n=1 Tax=Bifidobacterium phasiani TaxID=2834431 RepID=A0ABS6WB44_9BIFI|nr:glycoside hydrolase family 32 protein [Bifidobacterium phasiani]MBW3083728.1 glycoside hydrolase family 32 protein [Bifidobacterium phasiani]
MGDFTELNRPFAPHDDQLAKAERAVADLAAGRADRWYPRFHIASNGGWINDPNGLSHHRGRWNVFYQLHPYSAQWGPMHWGHVSSADLTTWRREPIALAPSIEAELAGVFSGSAVTGDDGRLWLYYTGHRWRNGVDVADGNLEVQCAAVSDDGVRFEKLGVVIDNPERLKDFRDPKVWKQDGRWYMVFGLRTGDERGEIVLYTSEDMRRWSFDRVLFRHPDPDVFMLECPDFYEIPAPDGTTRWVLCFSAMGTKPDGFMNRNANNAGYMIGTWEPGGAFEPQTEFRLWDWGPNYYAPQSMLGPDGRRIVLGWMNPADGSPTQRDGWCGQMTLPREVTLREDGDLHTTPVAEIDRLRLDDVDHGSMTLGRDEEREVLEDAEAVEIDLTIDLEATTAERCGLKLHCTDDGGYVYVGYDDQTRRVVLDRQAAGVGERGYRAAPLSDGELASGRIELRVYVDRGSVEVYVNDGRQAMSAYSLPAAGRRAVRLLAESGTMAVASLVTHRMGSIGLE